LLTVKGNRITPSYVAFTNDGERLIGDAAKNQLTSNPENTVFDAKRLIGRKFEDITVQNDMKYWPFTVVDKSGKPHIKIVSNGETKLFGFTKESSKVLPIGSSKVLPRKVPRFYPWEVPRFYQGNDFVLVDVNPLTLGIETVGGMMTKSETFRESGKSLKFNY